MPTTEQPEMKTLTYTCKSTDCAHSSGEFAILIYSIHTLCLLIKRNSDAGVRERVLGEVDGSTKTEAQVLREQVTHSC